MKHISFSFIILLSTNTIAQIGLESNSYSRDVIDYINIQGKNLKSSDLSGSIYYNKEKIEGKIIDNTEDKTIHIPLRYCIYDDAFEIDPSEKEDEKILLLNKTNKYSVILKEEKFIYINKLPIKINNKSDGYAIVLHNNNNNNTTLLKKLSQRISVETKSSYGQADKTVYNVLNNVNYFLEVNSNLVEIIPHKKKLTKLFLIIKKS